MNYNEAFTFVPNSESWVSKMLLAALFAALLPLGGLGTIPLLGWSILIARRQVTGQGDPLPSWLNLGDVLGLGLKAAVIWVVWYIPGWILLGLLALLDADIIVSLLLPLLAALYGVVVWILFVGVIGQLADDVPFGQALNPARAAGVVNANVVNAITAAIVGAAGTAVLAFLGIFICVVGILLGWAWAFAAIGHLYGQVYREATAKAAAQPG